MASNKQAYDTEFSEQTVLNRSYDRTTSALAVENLSYDGTGVLQRDISKNVALKVTTVGSVTYVAKAPVGSLQSSAVWQAKRIDSTSDTVITWAQGSASFSNVATDLTILTYS